MQLTAPRYPLSSFPTPLHRLERFETAFEDSPKLWIKRDDQTTLAFGGNKTRKLEFLLADARAAGADTVITTGGPQSNHCRLTAAASAQMGMACHVVLGGEEGEVPNGNALLDWLCGAVMHYVQPENRNARMASLSDELKEEGRKPYIVPLGGSNGLGAVGYALAMKELRDQFSGDWNDIDAIIVATSSGGTQAGLTVGARAFGFEGKILGLSIDQAADQVPSYQSEMAGIANESAKIFGLEESFDERDFHLNDDYLGGGYGVLSSVEKEATMLLAQHEGIFVGPVYTGRAVAGLIDLIRKGKFTSEHTVLFWHTGGAPALFAYAKELRDMN
jgi:D-cysteine desulfhydrase